MITYGEKGTFSVLQYQKPQKTQFTFDLSKQSQGVSDGKHGSYISSEKNSLKLRASIFLEIFRRILSLIWYRWIRSVLV